MKKLSNSPDINNIHDIFWDPKVLWSWWLKFTGDEVNLQVKLRYSVLRRREYACILYKPPPPLVAMANPGLYNGK